MEKNISVKPAIKQMQPNDMLSFPIEQVNIVRVYCSDLGATLNRKYKTRKSLTGEEVEVIRLS